MTVEVYDRDGGHHRPRVRFEVDARPRTLTSLLKMKAKCVACGQPIYPVRARNGATSIRNPGGCYLAVTCELKENFACARGRAAREAYTAIKLALRPDLK